MKLILELDSLSIPSVNHYWKACGHRRFISVEGLFFKNLLQETAIEAGFEIIDCDVVVYIVWYCAKEGRGDLDNKFKVILDALAGVAYNNDRQVTFLVADKKKQTGHNTLLIKVEPRPLLLDNTELINLCREGEE